MFDYINPTSVTFWSGLALLIQGVVSVIQTVWNGGDVGIGSDGLQKIAEGLGLIGLRRAVS